MYYSFCAFASLCAEEVLLMMWQTTTTYCERLWPSISQVKAYIYIARQLWCKGSDFIEFLYLDESYLDDDVINVRKTNANTKKKKIRDKMSSPSNGINCMAFHAFRIFFSPVHIVHNTMLNLFHFSCRLVNDTACLHFTQCGAHTHINQTFSLS